MVVAKRANVTTPGSQQLRDESVAAMQFTAKLENAQRGRLKCKMIERFTALLYHIDNLETLRMAYFSLKKEAAPGVA